jgi:hypothetical protein
VHPISLKVEMAGHGAVKNEKRIFAEFPQVGALFLLD